MRARLHRSVVAVALLLCWSASLAAQAAQEVNAWKPSREHPQSYESARARHSYLASTYRYEALLTDLRDELRGSEVLAASGSIHRRLSDAFDELLSRFVEVDFDAAIDEAPNAEAVAQVIAALADSKALGLFQSVNNRWFSGTPHEITWEEVEALPQAQYQEFLHRVSAVQRLLTELQRPNRERALRGIEDAYTRWRAYVFDGRSQYPWEMALNGNVKGHANIQQPPTTQWILLHPELGVEVGTAGAGAANLSAKESLVVQALGHIWYRWPQDTSRELKWVGVSGTVSLREDIRPGLGFTIHYGKVINVGVLWHDLDRDGNWFDDKPYVFTGVDLFRLAKKKLPGPVLKRIDLDTDRIEKIAAVGK